jgi:hypothetical protein
MRRLLPVLILCGALAAGAAYADDVRIHPVDAPHPEPTRPAMTFTRVNVGTGGTGFDTSARRDEVVILQGFWRCADVQTIRAANPATKVLVYQNISRTAVPDASGNYATTLTRQEAQSNPYGVNWASGVVEGQESWLHFVRPVEAAKYGEYALARLKQKLAESALKGCRFDGVFLDDDNSFAPNVDGGLPDSNGNGIKDEPADRVRWNAWMEGVNAVLGPGLRAAGYEAMPNLSGALAERNLESGGWEESQFGYFNRVFDEFMATWPDNAAQSQPYVNEAFRLIEVAQTKRVVYTAGVPNGDVELSSAFGLGMLLIQTEGYTSKANGLWPNYDAELWHPVYDRARALGQPLGAATSPSPGVWTRQFQGGSVRVDLNARTAALG